MQKSVFLKKGLGEIIQMYAEKNGITFNKAVNVLLSIVIKEVYKNER